MQQGCSADRESELIFVAYTSCASWPSWFTSSSYSWS